MDLNLFENLKKDIESNVTLKEFTEELSEFLKNATSRQSQDKRNDIGNEKEYRKERHLYLVTEDRNNEIYLWDFTDKSKCEFKEIITSEKLLSVAKEGAMLQYKNGEYELYSPYGYDIVSNDGKIEK